MSRSSTWLFGVAIAVVPLAACSERGDGGRPAPKDAIGSAAADSACLGAACDAATPTQSDAAAPERAPPTTPDARSGPDSLDRDAAAREANSSPDVAGGEPVPSCGVCSAYGEPELLGRVGLASLTALSGMAASRRNAGVVYVHNDRDQLDFFALSEAGALLAQYRLTGAGAAGRDLEDMEVARCGNGTCLYIADIGNNIAPMRSELVIFRVVEPEVRPGATSAGPIPLSFERFAYRYPDGASNHNAESLMIDSATGAAYIIDKRGPGQPSAVYKLATLDPAGVTTAVKVADLPVPMAADQPATSASAHPCGGGFLLRTNNTLYEFRIAPGTPFEEAFRAPPTRVPVGMEQQGEAVSYAPDGRGYYTTSERPSGPMAPIHRVRCR